MKLGRLLLAIYVLILSGLPCEVFCRDAPVAGPEQSSRPSPQEDSDRKTCSPCCLCATCPGFALPQPPRLLKITPSITPLVMAVLPPYQAPCPLEVPGRIWQPPRLG